MLTSTDTHALSALPLGSFDSTPARGGRGGVTGAGAGPRGQCRFAACPGVPQGAMPVSGMRHALGIGASVAAAGSAAAAASLALITSRVSNFPFPPLAACCFASSGHIHIRHTPCTRAPISGWQVAVIPPCHPAPRTMTEVPLWHWGSAFSRSALSTTNHQAPRAKAGPCDV
jgi:hypothetical protein